uniref:Uncharacterized protein n=1 Tax=Arundo donax TaxID=35708 RepID=A0A0A9GEY8_ARUDO
MGPLKPINRSINISAKAILHMGQAAQFKALFGPKYHKEKLDYKQLLSMKDHITYTKCMYSSSNLNL